MKSLVLPAHQINGCRTWAMTDWLAHFDERAGVLEYDNGLPRAEAEAQVVGEIYDHLKATSRPLPGILGELARASQKRLVPEPAPWLAGLGLASIRAPMWGIGTVVPEAGTYRPPLDGELGHDALIVPSSEAGALVDLVAHGVNAGRMLTRLGAAHLIGADEVEWARESGDPLFVFDDALGWLRGSTYGVVILDWQRAGYELDGVRVVMCSRPLAPRLYAATRKCWPPPTIAVPSAQDVRRAA